jgi:ubiquitin-like 1-activating enzyme E1 A
MEAPPATSETAINAMIDNAPSVSNGASAEATQAQANSGLSADDFALYDRQIRLWGAQAQERIRNAHILLVSLRALGTEIAKNLTLAGISSLTIVDDEPVTEEDLGSCYFLRDEDVGKPVCDANFDMNSIKRACDANISKRAECAIPRIQELNPRVSVTSGGALSDLLSKDQTFYEPYSVVIACDHNFDVLSIINTAARFAGRPFYAAAIHGTYGCIFADLVQHDFIIEREKSNVPTNLAPETITRVVLSSQTKQEPSGKTTEIVTKRETYCPLILSNSSPLAPDILRNRRKLKAVSPLLPCLRALFEFQRTYSRLPNHDAQDLTNFTSLATNKSRELQLPPETLKSEFLRSFLQNIGAEIITTAAFVGGRLAEDVINVLGKREQPIQNFALFDGENLQGPVYCLYSPPPEVTLAAMGALPQDAMVGATQMNGGASGMPQGMGVGGQSMDMGMAGMDGGFPESGSNMMNGDMQQFQQQQQQHAQPQVIE